MSAVATPPEPRQSDVQKPSRRSTSGPELEGQQQLEQQQQQQEQQQQQQAEGDEEEEQPEEENESSHRAVRYEPQVDPNIKRVHLPDIARKKVYIVLSLVLAVLLTCILLYDVMQIILLGQPERTTQVFSVCLLILHLLGLCLAEAALFFCHQICFRVTPSFRNAFILTVCHLFLLLMRIIYELLCCRFRTEAYPA